MDLTPAHKLAASRLFLTQEDVDDLIDFVRKLDRLKNSVVIDIDAGTGTTALAILQTSKKTIVYTFDNNQQNLDWAQKNLEAFDIDMTRWRPSWTEARQVANTIQFMGLYPALVLHDASHEEKDVREDLEKLIPVLSRDTIIWVHDYLPMPGAQETYPGVKIVCDELVEKGLVEQIKTKGIGFAGRVL